MLGLTAGQPAVASENEQPAETANPLFPFCIETHDAKKRSVEEQVALVKELGFSGLGHLWLKDVPERLKALDEAGLKLYWIHTTVNLNPDKPPFDPKLMEVLPLLKDRGVLLSINAVGRKMGISPHTAKEYLDRVRAKYGAVGRTARTRTELYAAARTDGLLPD